MDETQKQVPSPVEDVDTVSKPNPQPNAVEKKVPLENPVDVECANTETSEDAVPKKKSKDKMVPYSRLFRFATFTDKLLIFIGGICAAIIGSALPAFSLLFGEMLDSFQSPSSLVDDISELSVYLVYVALGAFTTGYLAVALLTITAEKQAHRTRIQYLGRLLYQDISWYDQNKPNEVASRLAEDLIKIQAGIGDKLASAIQYICTFIAGLILGFIQGWKLTLVILAFLPLLVFATASMKTVILKATKRAQDSYARAGAVAVEAISSIRVVSAFGGESAEVKRYTNELGEAEKRGVQAGAMIGLSGGIMILTMFSAYGVGLWYGSKLIVDDREDKPKCAADITADGCYTGGQVLQVFFAVLIGAMSLGQASPSFSAFAEAQAAAYKVFEMIDMPPRILQTGGETKGKGAQGGLSGKVGFKDVKFEYPSRPGQTILNKLNFSVEAGQTVAFVGASGCGKSTCIQLMQRLYDAHEGQVLIDDIDIRDYDVAWLRQQMGIVGQEPVLFNTSIRTNIALGKTSGHTHASQEEIESVAKAACAHDFILTLPQGYDTIVGDRGTQLSGGQKQRIAIARAMMRNPQLLLLDEATSALDTESERQVQRALDALVESGVKRTTIVIAHRLSTIRNADVIFVFDKGVVVEQGTHDSLMQKENGAYRRFVELQSGSVEDESNEKQNPVNEEEVEISEEKAKLLHDRSRTRTLSSHNAAPEDSAQQSGEVEKAVQQDDDVPLSRLWAYQYPEKWAIVGATFAAAVHGAIMPCFSLLFSTMLTTFYQTDIDKLKTESLKIMGGFFGIAVTSFVCNTCQAYLFQYAGQRLTTRLRAAAFSATLRQEIGFFDLDDNTAGRLSSRLAGDAALIKAALGERIGLIIQSMSSLLTGLIIAFVSSWRLSFVVLGVAPFMMMSGVVQMKVFAGLNQTAQRERNEAGQVAQEAMTNIRTLQAYGLQKYTIARFAKALEAPYKTSIKGCHVTGLGMASSQAVMFFAYALVFYVGAEFINKDWLNFEEMLRVFFAIAMAASGAGHASGMATDAAKAKEAKKSVFQLIDRTPRIDALRAADEAGLAEDPDRRGIAQAYAGIDAAPFVMKPLQFHPKGVITFENVGFRYPARPEQWVLRNFSLTVQAGETVAFVGPSGSGKSTLIQLAQRFYDPDEGRVLLDGVDVRSMNVAELRGAMGLVNQEPQLFGDSIQYNILYGRPGAKPLPNLGVPVDAEKDEAVPSTFHEDPDAVEAAKDANADKFVRAFRHAYATHVGDGGSQLSGGQKQRVAIARAIIRNPSILLLDEATSALDTESEVVVQAALDRLLEEHESRTTLVIAHRLSTIRNADKIVVINKGSIAETGKHDELLHKPDGLYRRLALAQGMTA